MVLDRAVTRHNHSHDAVPAEIIAEGSDPFGTTSPEAVTQDAVSEAAEVQDVDASDLGGEAIGSESDSETADTAVGEGTSENPFPSELDANTLRRLIEALIFAADKPINLQRLRQLTRVSDMPRLQQALAELADEYQDRGIALHEVSGGYQFRTNTAFSPWVQQLIAGRPVRLSRAQLETLAIIAYRQPITRPEIDEIRGVDSSATLRLLLDRALVRVLGKREEVGRPMLYGTTKEFLEFFSLGDLRELPTLREYSELTAESRKVVSDRLGVEATATEVAVAMEAAAAEVVGTVTPVDVSPNIAAVQEGESTGDVEAAAGDEVEAATSDEVESEAGDEVEAATSDEVESAAGDEVEAATSGEVESAAGDEVEAARSDEVESAAGDVEQATAGAGDLSEAFPSTAIDMTTDTMTDSTIDTAVVSDDSGGN